MWWLLPIAKFKADLEKEKPNLKEKVYDRERAADFLEAGRLCDEYAARYPGDVWGTWEHAQIIFALEDYNTASLHTAGLVPGHDPGDDMLCAIKFQCGDKLFGSAIQRRMLKGIAESLASDYGVQVCTVQMLPDRGLNVREKPDATSAVLYEFKPDEHVFAKQDRVRNSSGNENVTWRKVLLLPSVDRIHGGEGWVNERYIAPLNLADIERAQNIEPRAGWTAAGMQRSQEGFEALARGDYSSALNAFQKAADQGDPIAETNLGWMYHEGKGVPQDYRKAVELYQKAADQGDAVGQAYLASQYAEGKGVPRDYQKAVELFHKALNQGPDPNVYNDYAWFLATCPEASQRNGKEAVTYANKACQLSGWKQANFIGTLAAAFAEVGDFDAAVRYEKQEMAAGSDYPDRQTMEKALKLYGEGKPYREGNPYDIR